MTRTSIVAAALVLAAAPVRAQDAQGPEPQRTPSAATPPSPVVQMSPERLQRIYHIRQLESVLANAVKAGASTLAFQMQIPEPTLFVTTARARGFELEGYGVFFDVDVPAMLQSAIYYAQARQDQLQYLESLRATAANVKLDPTVRRIATNELNRLLRMMGLPQSTMTPPPAPPAPGVVNAANTTDSTPPETVALPVAALPDTRDPNERYTEAIKDKLIDVMLTYGSNALKLEDQEWLVIAARATSEPVPSGLDDSASIILRIKGADLNAFAQQKITKDEVIKRIEVKIG